MGRVMGVGDHDGCLDCLVGWEWGLEDARGAGTGRAVGGWVGGRVWEVVIRESKSYVHPDTEVSATTCQSASPKAWLSRRWQGSPGSAPLLAVRGVWRCRAAATGR
ncbi:hypothetical protein E2C01_065216 [Portunus trituberculatus]|uniref:Uncharacterized protein n=1 Tax=Portunus trituberculatus TaxID=210409 RepID=A0A5B7HDX3_PORTR|nr:hypothetical protein [Portunus trituberculatus]